MRISTAALARAGMLLVLLAAPLALGAQTAATGADSTVRRCPVELRHDDPLADAVRCAEAFIVRNGYTEAAPLADSLAWAPESEQPEPRAGWPRLRHGLLHPQAVAVCSGTRNGLHGYVVVFRSPDGVLGRGVNLVDDFSSLQMVRGPFHLSYLDNADAPCTRLPLPPAAAGGRTP